MLIQKAVEKLARLADERDLVQKILLQVNAGNDPAKFESPLKIVHGCRKSAQVTIPEVLGFMTIAPFDPENKNTAKETLQSLKIRDEMSFAFGRPFSELSMGMSGDLDEAISEGSTMIRVGSALFGERIIGKIPGLFACSKY